MSDSSPEEGTNPLSGIYFAFSFMLAQLCLQARWGRKGVQITLHPGGRKAAQQFVEAGSAPAPQVKVSQGKP